MLEFSNSNYFVKIFQSLKEIQSYFRAFVSKQVEEYWQDVLICLSFVNDWTNGEYILGKSCSNVGKLISFEVFETWDDLGYYSRGIENFTNF